MRGLPLTVILHSEDNSEVASRSLRGVVPSTDKAMETKSEPGGHVLFFLLDSGSIRSMSRELVGVWSLQITPDSREFVVRLVGFDRRLSWRVDILIGHVSLVDICDAGIFF